MIKAIVSIWTKLGRGRPRFQGFVDAVVNGDTVVGWCHDPRTPTRRLEVQLLDGSKVVSFALADLPRRDLSEAGIGDGRHGFRLRIPEAYFDGLSRHLRVCAITERGKRPLRRGELTVAGRSGVERASASGDRPAAAAIRNAPPLIGVLERITDGAVHGWAYNPDKPDAPALVDIYDDEIYLGSAPAERSRPRLHEKGFPSGARGFTFTLPPHCAPDVHKRLRARVAGTFYDLKRPKDFGRDAGDSGAGKAKGNPPASPAAAPNAFPPPPPSPPPPSAQPAGLVPIPMSDIVDTPHPVATGDVALWIVGDGDPGARATTLAAWAEQIEAGVRLIAPSAEDVPSRLHPGLFAPDQADPARLAREAAFVLLCRPGAAPPPQTAALLSELSGFPDVVCWADDRPFLTDGAARIDALLRPEAIDCLAVRTSALYGYDGALAEELAAGTLARLRVWLAHRPELRWLRLPDPSPASLTDRATAADAPPLPRDWLPGAGWRIEDGLPVPPARVEQVCFAFWDGWDEERLPTAITELFALRPAFAIEVLMPADRRDTGLGRVARVEEAAAAAGQTRLRTRAIECSGSVADRATALLGAADAEVVLLSNGSALPDLPSLERMIAWCRHPEIGPVGFATAEATSGLSLSANLDLRPVVPGDAGGAGAVEAVSFDLMAIAADKIAAAGGPHPRGFDAAGGAIELGLRLARYGFQPILVPVGMSGRPIVGASTGPLEWTAAARFRASGLIGGRSI